MPTYSKAPIEISELAEYLLNEFRESHDKSYGEILDSDLRIDLMLAYADRDDRGEKKNDAITHQGRRALGLCKIIKMEDRAAGLGDVRILLDGDDWDGMTDVEQRSLLDHELHHIIVSKRDGAVLRDDLNRPKLKMRQHDIELGIFSVIAARHGKMGIERRDFRKVMDEYGQYLMPEVFGEAGGTIIEAARKLRESVPKGTTMSIKVGEHEPVVIGSKL